LQSLEFTFVLICEKYDYAYDLKVPKMLFKEILEQPTKGPSNPRAPKCGKLQKKLSKKPAEKRCGPQQKPKVCATKLNRRGASARNPNALKNKCSSSTKSQSSRIQQITKFDANIPSSTPVFTPIKKDKLRTSVTSSQCSLIELLQQYNTSTIQQNVSKEQETLDKTLTQKPSRVATPEQTVISPQLHTFKEVLSKLLRTVETNIDFENNSYAVNQAFEDVQVAFKSLNPNSSKKETEISSISSKTSKSTNAAHLSNSKMQELQIENASLQKQLRLTKKEIETHANKSTTTTGGVDISLELMTIQCQNKALEQKVSELTIALEQALYLQHSIVDANTTLKMENQKLKEDLFLKQDELAKSGDLFSFETREIKKDVGDALQKVEQLKVTLDETSKMNQDLIQQAQVKDKEILRLTELNKGLQSSVSRLLEDLRKASQPIDQSINIKSEVLKKVDQFLSSPPRKLVSASPNKPKSPKSDHFCPGMMGDAPSTVANQNYLFHGLPITRDITLTSVHEADDNSGSVSRKSILGSTTSPSLPTTDSVSCSMWSITSRDERDFNAGLASLDADIQKLQTCLNQLNV